MAADPLEELAARIAELERRLDKVYERFDLGEPPIHVDPGKMVVSDEVLELARSGKEKDMAKAALLHVRQTGADLHTAEQAIRDAL
jgi:hypothetical protein